MARADSLPRTSKFLTLASICIVVAALYLAREVLIPLALALLLTFLVAPLVTRLERFGLRRVLAVILVVLTSFVLIGLFGWIIDWQIRELVGDFPAYKTTIVTKVHTVQNGLGALVRAQRAVNELTMEATSQPTTLPSTGQAPVGTADNPAAVSIVSNSAEPGQRIVDILDSSLGYLAPLGDALVVVVFVMFMLIQREDLRDRVIRLAGSGRLTVTTQAIDEAASRVSAYLLKQSIVNGSFAALASIGLLIIGVPNPLLWGILCGILRFIPYVGVWVGAVFPIVLSLVLPGWVRPVLTICMFIVFELLTGNFLEPLLYGASTGVSSIAILIAAIFWTWLWGGVGLLLSTPLTVCLVVMGKYVPHLEFLNVLLGDEPVLKPFERLYQRLLASDKTEAFTLLKELVKSQGTQHVYEAVLLPALAKAQRDYANGDFDEPHYEALCDRFRAAMEEVGAMESQESSAQDANRAVDIARHGVSDLPRGRPPLPKDCNVNVLCVPAHGEADAIAAAMLGAVLQRRGFCVKPLGPDRLASEVVAAVEQTESHLVVISALPPNVIASARYLVKKLRMRFPDLRIVIGLWSYRGDLSRVRPRLGRRPAVEIVIDFAQAQDRIEQIIQPVLIQGTG